MKMRNRIYLLFFTLLTLITLSACNSPKTFDVTFDSNGGSVVSPMKDVRIEDFEMPEDPEKEGYNFGGWYLDQGVFVVPFIGLDVLDNQKDRSILVYAKWDIDTYVLKFLDGDDQVLFEQEVEYDSDLSLIVEPVASKSGYRFIGWDEELPSRMPAMDVTLKAQYELNQYSIYFESNGGSEVESITQAYDASILEPDAPIKEGYTFAGWYIDEELTSIFAFSTMPAIDSTLYAKWILEEYTITYHLNGGINDEANPTTFTMYTDNISLKEPSKQDTLFLGWYSQPEFEGAPIEALMFDSLEEIHLYAKWDEPVAVEVEFDPSGGFWRSDVFRLLESEAMITATTLQDSSGESLTILRSSIVSYRWFYKVFIAYDAAFDAYKIVAVDPSTANIMDLALPEFDFVLAVHDYCMDTDAYQTIKNYTLSPSSIGTFVLFDRDLSTYSSGEIVATFFESSVSVNTYRMQMMNQEPLLIPNRIGYHFLGWSDGEEIYTIFPQYKESMGIVEVMYTAVWESNFMEVFSEYMADLLEGGIYQDIALPNSFGEHTIIWESSHEEVVSTSGEFKRSYQAVRIHLTAKITTDEGDQSIMFEVDISGYKSLDQAIASSYIYRNFSLVTDAFFETLDIINTAFITADANGNLSGTAFLNNVNQHIMPKAKQHGNWVILSIAPSSQWSTIASSAAVRTTFANSIVTMINQYGFDGVDIDWEYPKTDVESQNFTLLMEVVYEKVKANNPNHLVTAAISGGRWQPPRYDLLNSAQYIDYINMMTYGLTNNTGYYQNALYPSSTFFLPSMSAGRTLVSCSIEESIAIFQNDFQIPLSKIIVGVAFYGIKQVRTYNQETSSWSGWSRSESGSVRYHTLVSQYFNNSAYTVYYDTVSQVPFIVKNDGTEFISYDDPRSIQAKSTYILDNGLAGMMYWENGADTTGQLLAAMRSGLNK